MWMAEATKMAAAAVKMATVALKIAQAAQDNPQDVSRRPAKRPALKKPAAHASPAKKPALKKPAARVETSDEPEPMPGWTKRDENGDWIMGKTVMPPTEDARHGFRWLFDPESLCWEMQKVGAPARKLRPPGVEYHRMTFDRPGSFLPAGMPAWMQLDEDGDWIVGKLVVPPPCRPSAGFRWLLDPVIGCWEMQKIHARKFVEMDLDRRIVSCAWLKENRDSAQSDTK